MNLLCKAVPKEVIWIQPKPCFKHFKVGMPYHEFRTKYQKLLGIYHPRKEYFQRQYGEYCLYHKRMDNE